MNNKLCFLILTAVAGLSCAATAQNTFPANGDISVSDSATFGTGHWNTNANEGLNYVALSTFGGTIVRGNSINAGGLTVGAWTKLASPAGLYVAGDSSFGSGLTVGANFRVHGKILSPTLELEADLQLGTVASGQNRILGSNRLLIQAGEALYLQPSSGQVIVGGGGGPGLLQVIGTVSALTLELTSDRNQKQDIQPVAGKEIARKVASLPISTWAYTNSPGIPHLGPMAQDFKAAFNLGEDDKHIGAGDGIGVALAAIKGLHEMVQETKAQLESRDARVAALEKKLTEQEQSYATRLGAMEKWMAATEAKMAQGKATAPSSAAANKSRNLSTASALN